MIKRMNILFFGTCFLAALIAEAYCMQVLKGDLFSTIGIGIVVLITGYLFMDSIISKIKKSSDNARFYLDHIFKDEADKWNERYTELVNLQKATYTATKKNSALLAEQFGAVLTKLEAMELNYTKELQKIIELQKKSMEGQKNALNLEIHYNKENTKQLINVFHEEGRKSDVNDQLSRILDLLENYNELLKLQSEIIEKTNNVATTGSQNIAIQEQSIDHRMQVPSEDNLIPDQDLSYEDMDYELNNLEDSFIGEVENSNTVLNNEIHNIKSGNETNIEISSGIDEIINNNDALSDMSYSLTENDTDTIGTDILGIDGIGTGNIETDNIEKDSIDTYSTDTYAIDLGKIDIGKIDIGKIDSGNIDTYKIDTDIIDTNNIDTNNIDTNNIDTGNTVIDNNETWKKVIGDGTGNKKAPDFISSFTEELKPEAMDFNNEKEMMNNPVVTPLYEDPNKNLTADEIAALFASVGR